MFKSLLFIVSLSIISLCLGQELKTYEEYLVFAAKHGYRNVSQYADYLGFTDLDYEWTDFVDQMKWEFRFRPEVMEKKKFHYLKMKQFIENHTKEYSLEFNRWGYLYFKDYDSLSKSTPHPFTSEYLKVKNSNKTIVFNSSVEIPDSFDWRDVDKVSLVKNQGDCGSCYAFAITGMMESAHMIKNNQSLDLSEQQIIDCDSNEDGCGGGMVGHGLEYAKNVGIETEDNYPYYEEVHRCVMEANDGYKNPFRISDYGAMADVADDDIKKLILQFGPIVATIDNSDLEFHLYKRGIISDGDRWLNHVVLIVGWNPDYWIMKNSWGPSWGEDGYARIATGDNVRGINSLVYFASL